MDCPERRERTDAVSEPTTEIVYTDDKAPQPPDMGILTPFPGVTMTARTDLLFAALARAQGRMRHAEKGREGYENRYRYANLSDVLELLLPVLSPEGLSIVQLPHSPTGEVLTLTSMLCHESGQWIATRATMPIPVLRGSSPMQSLGAVSSFLRRYLAQAQAGQASADEDSDGHDSESMKPASSELINALASRLKAMGSDSRKVLEYYNVRDLHEMTADMVAHCNDRLDQRVTEAEKTKAAAEKMAAEAKAAKEKKPDIS